MNRLVGVMTLIVFLLISSCVKNNDKHKLHLKEDMCVEISKPKNWQIRVDTIYKTKVYFIDENIDYPRNVEKGANVNIFAEYHSHSFKDIETYFDSWLYEYVLFDSIINIEPFHSKNLGIGLSATSTMSFSTKHIRKSYAFQSNSEYIMINGECLNEEFENYESIFDEVVNSMTICY